MSFVVCYFFTLRLIFNSAVYKLIGLDCDPEIPILVLLVEDPLDKRKSELRDS